MSHSTSQESLMLSPSYSNLPRPAQSSYIRQDKRAQYPAKTVVIRQVPNLRPYALNSVFSLEGKKMIKPKEDLLNITDSFQYRCEGILEDALPHTLSISKVRRKSDASNWSGGLSVLEKKIGSLMHESLFAKNTKPSLKPKSNSNSPSKLRSVRRALAVTNAFKQDGRRSLKRQDSSKDAREGKDRRDFNRISIMGEPNASLIRQVSVKRGEDVSHDLIHAVDLLNDAELLKVSKLTEHFERDSSKEQKESKNNTVSQKKKPESKLHKVLGDIKVTEEAIKKNVKKSSKTVSQDNTKKKVSKSIENKSLTGSKRNIFQALKLENEPKMSRLKSPDSTEDRKKNRISPNTSQNSLDEEVGNINGTDAVNMKEGNAATESEKLGDLPIIEEENANNNQKQTEESENLRKTKNTKWRGIHSLCQLPTLGEKRSTSPTFKHYFKVGIKKNGDNKTICKVAQSMKIEASEEKANFYSKEGKDVKEQEKRKTHKILRRLFTPKISSAKQIITAYSMSNVASPQA